CSIGDGASVRCWKDPWIPERTRRAISHSNSCTLCGHDFEDLAHILRDCPSAKDVWMLVILDQLKQMFFSVSFQDWLILNLCFHERLQGSATEVVKVSSCWARQYESHLGGHKNNNQSSNFTNNSNHTWVYLSAGGAVGRDFGYAATGGAAHDHDENWIVGFTRFLGVCFPFEVEVWGILDGILILLNRGYARIIIMTDNLEVTQNLTALDLEDSEITCFKELNASSNQKGSGRLSMFQEI
ncbi:hypothetical protein Golax_021678, partial [Gossypium laxum]|nr:hypothetical protein [Gossypium laxum]